MPNDRIAGVIVPLVTPLTPNGQVDIDGLRAQVRRCIEAGAAAVFAGGSAGAGPLLRQADWELMARIVWEEAQGQCKALIGIIATSTALALDRIATSRQIGYDTIVVTPTFYITLTRDSEMLAHFEACRNATDQAMILYNIPGCTGSAISVAAMSQMVKNNWGVAIKESSGDPDYFRQLLQLSRETGISVLQGNETDIGWSLLEGAAGIVPVCANYDPALFVNAYSILTSPDGATRRAGVQQQLDALREALLVGDHNWIAGITWGLKSLGIGTGIPPLPLQPVDAARALLIEALHVAGQLRP